MVTTPLPDTAAPPGPRLAARRAPVVTTRAVVGGLLVTLAAVGTFVAVQTAGSPPESRYVVAVDAIDVGERLRPAHLATVTADLPPAVAEQSFRDPAALAGAVALAPIRPGSLISASQVLPTDAAAPAAYQVSIRLPRDRAVNGVLDRGEWVDVLATYGTGTEAETVVVARDAVVTAIGSDDDAGLGDDGGFTLTLDVDDADAVLRLVHARDVALVTLVRATRSEGEDGADQYSGPASPTTPTTAPSTPSAPRP